MLKMSVYRFLLSFCILYTYSHCYNLDINHTIIYEDPLKASGSRGSYFGFSLLLYSGNGIKPWIQIGAPRGNNSNYVGVEEPGVVFRCPIAGKCKSVLLDKVGNDRKTVAIERKRKRDYYEDKNGAWIGGAMDIDEKDGRVAVCGHRWKYLQHEDQLQYMLGICYWSKVEQDITDDRGVYRLVPLHDPNFYFSPLGKNPYGILNYGVGQAGISVHFPRNQEKPELLLGAPGVANWKGTTVMYKATTRNPNYDVCEVADPRDINDVSYGGIAQYSLFGYHVTSGRFDKTKTLYYVAGNPKGMQNKGKVYVYRYYSTFDIDVVKILSGSQVGEYFGSSLAVADLNCDGIDDLIVGAPQHTKEHDEGSVYVFYSNSRTTIFDSGIKLMEGGVGGRFGSSVVALGDLDNDGCQDIAVGAPYANNGTGVVYIYNGDIRDPSKTQEIIGSKINPDLKGFGISISRAADIDGNKYPDIAVGAYLSGQVVLFRTQPVVALKTNVTSYISELQRNATSFIIHVCLSFEGKHTPRTLSVLRTIVLDERNGRAHFGSKSKTDTTKIEIINNKHCQDLEVFLVPGASLEENTFDPITIKVSQEMIYTETKKSVVVIKGDYVSQSQDGFQRDKPVINARDSTFSAELSIPFAPECGNRDICESELELNCGFSGLKKGGYIIGSKSRLKLLVNLTNHGEPAFLTTVAIDIPSPLQLSSGNKDCKETHSMYGSYLTCNMGNPLRNGTLKNLTLNLDTDSVKPGFNNLSFYISVYTLSKDKNEENNSQILSLLFITEADVIITGRSEVSLYSYSRNNRTVFKHRYEVQKQGLSPIDVVETELRIPYRLKRQNDVIELVDIYAPMAYLDEQPLQCSNDKDYKYIVEETEDRVESIGVMSREKRETYNDVMYREKREAIVEQIPVNQTLFLNCSLPNIECVNIKCQAGPFDSFSKNLVSIELKMSMNNSNLVASVGAGSTVYLYTTGSVSIKEPKNIQIPNRLHNAIINTTFINGTHIEGPEKQVSTWVIALSIIAGVLVFMFITIGLMKAGFFERKKKAELENLIALYAEQSVFPSGPPPQNAEKTAQKVTNDDESVNNDESEEQ